MNNIPVPHNEKDRLKALHNYYILDSLSEVAFDRITEIASIICNVPISLITLIDEDRQWIKSAIGIDSTETARDQSFCAYTIMGSEIFEIDDTTTDDRFKNNPMVTGDAHIRFYAGYPLIDEQGYALGSLCVVDRKPNILKAEQKRALKLLARQISELIVERRKKEELRNFEKLFELSNDLVFIGGMDGYFKKINPAFERLFGWSEEYILKTSSFEFYHPDDIETTKKELEKLARGAGSANFLQRFKTSSGEYKTIEWTSTPEVETGNIYGIGRDVSELILKEKQLAVSEEKLRIFFENSQGLMCTHDMAGNFVSVNAAGAAILGYTRDEVLKLSLFDIVPAERHVFLRKYLTEIMQNGQSKGQMFTMHRDGSPRIWMFNNTLQHDVGNEPYVIGNAIDITERHYLEEDLKRTGQMLEQTNKVARVGGWEYDVIKGTVYWTSVTKEIHGVSPDYAPQLATSLSFYKEGESREKIQQVFAEAMEHGTSYNEELQIINVQGEELWVRAIGNAEFKDGICIRVFGTFQDIDVYKYNEMALKRSIETQERLNQALFDHIELVEKRDKTIEKIQEFKFLADSIPQIVWTSNPDGSPDYYNQHWFDYTGMSLAETLDFGRQPVLHPDDLTKDFNAGDHSVVSGKPYQSEVRFKRASDGVYRWHLGRAVAMRDSAGKVVKWFGSFTDIDEYKRALDLENRISQFEDFNRIVAHNLRGPAGSIQMILEMFAETDSAAEKQEYLTMLRQSSTTLIDTLNELMKVLEVRNNKSLPYELCNLDQIVNGIKVMLRGQIVSKKAIISTSFKAPTMLFPKMYLESIFYNMISNALKYSKTGVTPDICITSKKEQGRVILTFSDNGLGIDLDRHGNNIFKLNQVFHSGYDSKGIGLFMTKTQIETFGGQISVMSQPGVGTTFTIVF